MNTRLINHTDLLALQKIALLQDVPVVRLLAHVAEQVCPAKQDFTCKVAKQFLPPSYQFNPSLFAQKIKSLAPSFEDAGGGKDPDAPQANILITLYREYRDRSTSYQTRSKNSLKQKVKEAIAQGYILTVPHSEIPPFTLTHPEQLTYAIKKETGNRIKITKLKSSWKIQLI